MACTLQPQCNFLHGFFECQLLVETVDVEVRITSMQGPINLEGTEHVS